MFSLGSQRINQLKWVWLAGATLSQDWKNTIPFPLGCWFCEASNLVKTSPNFSMFGVVPVITRKLYSPAGIDNEKNYLKVARGHFPVRWKNYLRIEEKRPIKKDFWGFLTGTSSPAVQLQPKIVKRGIQNWHTLLFGSDFASTKSKKYHKQHWAQVHSSTQDATIC